MESHRTVRVELCVVVSHRAICHLPQLKVTSKSTTYGAVAVSKSSVVSMSGHEQENSVSSARVTVPWSSLCVGRTPDMRGSMLGTLTLAKENKFTAACGQLVVSAIMVIWHRIVQTRKEKVGCSWHFYVPT